MFSRQTEGGGEWLSVTSQVYWGDFLFGVNVVLRSTWYRYKTTRVRLAVIIMPVRALSYLASAPLLHHTPTRIFTAV